MIANMRDVPVFMDRYVWWITCPLDPEAMRAASTFLIGRHDFTSFRGSGCGAKNPVRTVHSLEVEKLCETSFLFTRFQGECIKIAVEADAFLRHMVRNMVGTLVEAGRGRLSPERVKVILESRDRRLAGPTAPARGLFLEKVSY
jgi:tRNA pseudouridine38-40 synthase